MNLIRLLPACILLASWTGSAPAQEPIRFARTPDISPDGKLITFSYQGDIYTCETIGGTARAVTSHPAHDINPVFSPDGRWIAFSSNRHGSYDVFVVGTRGGKPKRLTFDAASDMACGWSPDGKCVLFASTRSMAFPSSYELYTVPAEGGRVRRITPAEGKEGTFSPKGDLLAYVRGPGSWYRKGYRGSSNDDIWVGNADGSNSKRLTTFEGQDHSPMWSADGSTIYYVSEHLGTANVVKVPLASLGDPTKAAKPTPVTAHADEAVRKARISKNGEWIVYECGGDLWVVGTGGEYRPRKVAIEVDADEKSNNERVTTFTSGATEFALTADEKFAAFAVHGKLFRVPVGPTPRPTQLTFGSSNDHSIAWAPDGSKIIFVSDRNGHDDLYLLTAKDPDHPKFTEAHRFEVAQLTDTREAESGVSFSPDGKHVAFLRGGKLLAMNPDGKEIKILVGEAQVFDYEWSPDSKWLVYARRDGSFASELYIVPSTGATAANPVRNVTRYATTNAGVTWSADGKRIAFLSDRRGGSNLHVLDLEKPAVANGTPARPVTTWTWGGKPALPIDWEDIHLRVKPVIQGQVAEAAISPDGSRIALRDASNNDLWVASSTGGNLTRITTGGVYPRNIQWSKRRNLLGGALEFVYFLDGTGQVRLCNVGSAEMKPGTDRTAVMPFRVKMNIRQDELFAEMFDQSWRYLSENFYDDKYHGRDWSVVRKTYRPLVKHISMKEDLYALLYLMMGELNASHLGVSGPVSGPEENTAELGLLWDEAYRGKGLKVAEVLKRGPADRKGLDLKAGDFVVAIDGVEIDDNVNLAKLLNGKAGEPVMLQVTADPNDPKAKKRRVELSCIGRGRSRSGQPGAGELMYERWVARNAARVAEKSGGRLGYIHIPSMDEDGLDRFVRSLYSDNFDKDAIVLDVRFNGGGFTHDQVLNYLGSKEHTVFKTRDGGTGLVLRSWDRKWHKPLTLLINNRSYSDAEIFPSAFRTLGLGKLVGESTGGFVIGTSAMRLIDGSTFRIPRIGVYTTGGENMDKVGVRPDVTVENQPDLLAKGIDSQLDRAVEVLEADVVVWKKKRAPVVVVAPKLPEKAGPAVVGPVVVPKR